MTVAIKVKDAPAAHGGLVSLEKRIVVTGDIPTDIQARLRRTAEYCSVGQYFTKRALTIQDHVEVRGATDSGPSRQLMLPDKIELPVFVPGRVSAQYLLDTQEWVDEGGRKTIAQEGEVKVHVQCGGGGPTRGGRWGLLGGHMSEGWGPVPVALAIGALVASTAATLRLLAPALEIDPMDIEVAAASSSRSTKGKHEAQDAAASGRVRDIPLSRKATVRGVGPAVCTSAVEQAMRLDPIYRMYAHADLAVDEQVIFQPASKKPLRATFG
jgi:uncharacterized OsmC-like protein